MNTNDINAQIGEAAIARKQCLDQISCYRHRLKQASQALQAVLDPDYNPLHEDRQALIDLTTDPCADIKGYLEALKREQDLADFLRTHNAL